MSILASSRLGLLAVLLLPLACRTPAPPGPAVSEAVEGCEESFIAETWLSEGLLVLGELHGTRECPLTAGQVACRAAARAGRAWLGLEIPWDEGPRVEAFLAGGGEAELLAGPFWRRVYQDGRSSQGMLELLRGVRRMRQAGREVRVLLFDVTEGEGERDKQMAARIAEVRARAPGEPMVVLVGNVHAMRRPKVPRSMVWHLQKAGVALRTLDVAVRGGSAWLCGASCGIDALTGEDLGPKPRVIESEAARQRGYDGLWYLVEPTASPPAVR